MEQIDSLTFHILNAMADDWESIAQIEPQIAGYVGGVDRSEIFTVLRRLYVTGDIRAMDENGYGVDAFPDDPALAWFSMTDSGRGVFERNFSRFDDD